MAGSYPDTCNDSPLGDAPLDVIGDAVARSSDDEFIGMCHRARV